MTTTYVKTVSLDCDEVAVVLMALSERRVECERLAAKYEPNPTMAAYWAACVLECEAIQARFAALAYHERSTPPATVDSVVVDDQITDEELAALLEEEALEDARIAQNEADIAREMDRQRQAAYDHDSRFEYEYEDRLHPFEYSRYED